MVTTAKGQIALRVISAINQVRGHGVEAKGDFQRATPHTGSRLLILPSFVQSLFTEQSEERITRLPEDIPDSSYSTFAPSLEAQDTPASSGDVGADQREPSPSLPTDHR